MGTGTAVVVLADPAGGDEAAGRVFNALAAASDFGRRGQDVMVLFQGAATRWAALLAGPAHPFHGLYRAVQPWVAGVSDACSRAFAAKDAAIDAGVGLVGGNTIEGVGELPSLADLAADGYRILTF
jgi:hypothetical protein